VRAYFEQGERRSRRRGARVKYKILNPKKDVTFIALARNSGSVLRFRILN
jgi:hypothetical protein